MANPLVIIHGYSDKGKSFLPWREKLKAKGVPVTDINICNYISLSNEITIKDVAAAFDRALRARNLGDKQFDAMVHSTGMLVIRSWLAENPEARLGRLNRLVAIAPATFGSPLASEGRSPMGALFKGSKHLGPDFMAAGDLILDALELGSRFTWDLTHQDLFGDHPFYGLGSDTPYVFIFCGTDGYSGLKGLLVNKPGTDGTVRWAGCSLNTEKFVFDFRRATRPPTRDKRFTTTNANSDKRLPIPFYPIAGINHGTIVSDPPDSLVDLVNAALQVNSAEAFSDWQRRAELATKAALDALEAKGTLWQQFVIRAVDQHGDAITDYHLEVVPVAKHGALGLSWSDADLDMQPYSSDKSFRCYHVNVAAVNKLIEDQGVTSIRLRVMASAGSRWVDYHGEGSEVIPAEAATSNEEGKWDALIDIPVRFDDGPAFFYAFTTTLIELIMERDAIPFGTGPADLVMWQQ